MLYLALLNIVVSKVSTTTSFFVEVVVIPVVYLLNPSTFKLLVTILPTVKVFVEGL